jgi:hypothetical protein
MGRLIHDTELHPTPQKGKTEGNGGKKQTTKESTLGKKEQEKNRI